MRDLAITVREMDARPLPTRCPPKITRDRLRLRHQEGHRQARQADVKEIASPPRARKKSPHPIKTHPTVLMVLGVGRTPYVFLSNSWGGSIVKAAGGKLLGGELKDSGGFVKVSDEYVVQQDPDVILAVPHGNASGHPVDPRAPEEQPGVVDDQGRQERTRLRRRWTTRCFSRTSMSATRSSAFASTS